MDLIEQTRVRGWAGRCMEDLRTRGILNRPAHLQVIMPTGKRVESHPNGPMATNVPTLTAAVRESPHFVNSHGNLGLMLRAQGLLDPVHANALEHLQRLAEQQDGRNAAVDDRELEISTDTGLATSIVILWGGWRPFLASLELARRLRAVRPQAYIISACCDCECDLMKRPALTQAEREGTINRWLISSECSGLTTMRIAVEEMIAAWPKQEPHTEMQTMGTEHHGAP